jgi:hypothetical protein
MVQTRFYRIGGEFLDIPVQCAGTFLLDPHAQSSPFDPVGRQNLYLGAEEERAFSKRTSGTKT